MKVLIKAMRPHRQKVLTEDGEEMRLQQWANKAASSALHGAGGDANGEQFTQARDALMREAVANPDEHNLKFMGERMPFDGQELEESLSDPNVESEMPQTPDENWTWEQGEAEYMRNLKPQTPDLFDEQGKLRDGMPPEEEFKPDAEAEHMRRIMTSRQVPMRDAWSILKNLQFPADAGNRREFQRMPGEEHGPNDKFFRYGENPYVPKGHGEKPMRAERPHPYSQLGANVMEDYQLMQEEPEDNQLLTPDELAFAQSIAENDGQMAPAARMPAPTLREGMNQYNPPIKTSRQVPMRDAWSILKNDFFNPPKVPCAKCGKPTEPMMYYGSNEMGPQDNTLCEECEDNTMMEDQ